MRINIISALMKIENPDGTFRRYSSFEDFQIDGGEIAVCRAPNWKDPLPYEIILTPLDWNGLHLVETAGQQPTPPPFCPWLLIRSTRPGLNYTLLRRPEASDGQVLLA